MASSIFFLLGLVAIQHLAVALNQRAELGEFRLVVLEEGELLSSRQAAPDSAGLAHLISAGHGFTPQRFHPLREGMSGDENWWWVSW